MAQNKKMLLPFILLLGIVTACSGQESTVKKHKIPKAKAAVETVGVDTPDAFKDVKNVIVGGFIVGFKTSKIDVQEIAADAHLKKGQAIAETSLSGVTDHDLQGITDAAYAHFTQTLTAKGYNIKPRADLLSSSQFAGVQLQKNPYVLPLNGKVAGSEKRYFAPSVFNGIPVFLSDIAGLTGGFGLANPALAAQKYADKTGTRIVHVSYLVDFSKPKTMSDAENKAPMVIVTPGIEIEGDATRLGLIGDKGDSFSKSMGYISLGAPITPEGTFADVKDTTTETAKNLQAVANVIDNLSGGAGNRLREYEVRADVKTYRSKVVASLNQASTRMVEKMQALKKPKK